MSNKKFAWLSLIVILVLVLSACASPAEVEETAEPEVVEQPVVEEPTATEAPTATEEPVVEPTEVEEVEEVEEPEPPVADEEDDDDEDERMMALITEKVGDCHETRRVFNSTKTREGWSETIDRMIGYGANITPEEKEMMIDWLVSREQ